MYKILIWGTGYVYSQYLSLIQLNTLKESIEVVGITSNENELLEIDGFRFVPKEEIAQLDFDYCLVAVENMAMIWSEAATIGIGRKKLIPISVLAIPYFDFEKYICLKESDITIISPMCFGGGLLHRLGLEFKTPTINMWFQEEEYLKFISNLKYYIEKPVENAGTGWDSNLRREYPIGKIEDISLYFNHYSTFEEAKECWERRKQRINWGNILYIAYTTEPKMEKRFNALEVERKIVFVPYSTTYPASVSVYTHDCNHKDNFGMVVNDIATGHNHTIELLSLLLGEKKYRYIRRK